jgi:hypothetical protein
LESTKPNTRNSFPVCVGCGYCCSKGVCMSGVLHFETIQPPCPGLIWDEEARRHWCKLVLEEIGNIKEAVAIGFGCASSSNSYRRRILANGKTKISR